MTDEQNKIAIEQDQTRYCNLSRTTSIIMRSVMKWVVVALLFIILIVCGIIMSPLLAFSILAESHESYNKVRMNL